MEASLAEQAVLVFTVLLFIAAAVASAVKRVRLPYAVALVVTGALLAVLLRKAADGGLIAHHRLDGFELTPGLVLYVLLPILIFQAAFNIESRRLLRNVVPIIALAIPAVLISTAIVGGVLVALGDVPHDRALVAALLFGSMVSTTDAVAVVAIFRGIGAPRRLTMLVEGEALFNTGTALVLFGIIAAILVSPGSGSGGFAALLLGGIADFVWMGVGGLAFGGLVGLVCSWLLAPTEDPRVEITLTTVCAFSAYLGAGQAGVSDIMAVIGAGLLVGNYGRTKISPDAIGPLEHYWGYLAFVANSIVFLLVGLSLQAGDLRTYAGSIAVAIAAVVLARAVGIFSLFPIVNRIGEATQRVDARVQSVIWWGGMRGALVLVVALSLSTFDAAVLESVGGSVTAEGWLQWVELKAYFLHLAFGVVFFTILVNASTLTPLISVLGLGRVTAGERAAAMQARLLAKGEARRRLHGLKKDGVVSADVYDVVADRYLRAEAQLRRELALFRRGEAEFTVEDERRMLLGHCLGGEKVHIGQLFYRGEVAEWVMKNLQITLDNQLDLLKRDEEPDEDELARAGASRLGDRVRRWLGRLLGRGRLADALRATLLGRDYELALARLSAIEAALGELGGLEKAGAVSNASLRALRAFYEGQRAAVRKRLDGLATIFPDHAERMQESLSERFCLQSEEETLRDLVGRGRVPEKAVEAAVKEIRSAMDRARDLQRGSKLIRPDELVRRIPFFADLPADELHRVAEVLKPISYLEGETVMRQGDPGETMYLIATGSVEVLVADPEADGGARRLAELGEGDFFGEIALLSPLKRTATVRTTAPCALLELGRDALERLTGEHRELDRAMRRAYRMRILSTILSGVPAFRDLSATERDTIADAFKTRRFTEGDALLERGRILGALWVVERGAVHLIEERGDATEAAGTEPGPEPGEPEATRIVGEGMTFGEAHVFFPSAVPFEARAAAPVVAFALGHLDLLAALSWEPDLRAKVEARVRDCYDRELPEPFAPRNAQPEHAS